MFPGYLVLLSPRYVALLIPWYLSCLLSPCSAFLMTRVDPGSVLVSPGERVELLCQVDTHYEYCTWTNPRGETCDFEWKRKVGNITMQECMFPDRIAFHGQYNDKECGIALITRTMDQGQWSCEMEDYVLMGRRGSGARTTGTVSIMVRSPSTTTTTTSTSTTTSITTSTTTTRSTTSTPTIVSTLRSTLRPQSRPTPEPQQTTPQPQQTTLSTVSPSSSSTTPEVTNWTSQHPGAKPASTSTPDQTVVSESSGSTPTIVGSVLVFLVALVAAIFGWIYCRMRTCQLPGKSYKTLDNTEIGGEGCQDTEMMEGLDPPPVDSANNVYHTNYNQFSPHSLSISD